MPTPAQHMHTHWYQSQGCCAQKWNLLPTSRWLWNTLKLRKPCGTAGHLLEHTTTMTSVLCFDDSLKCLSGKPGLHNNESSVFDFSMPFWKANGMVSVVPKAHIRVGMMIHNCNPSTFIPVLSNYDLRVYMAQCLKQGVGLLPAVFWSHRGPY